MESEKQSEVGNFFGESRCVSARLPIWRKLPLEFRLSLDSSIKQPRPRRSWARGSLSIAGSTVAERERTGRLPGASAAPQSSRARFGVGSPGAPPLPFLAPEDPAPPGAQRCAPPLAPRGSGAQSPPSPAASPAANAPRRGSFGMALPAGCCARRPAGRSGSWQGVGQAAQPRCSSAPAERGARMRVQRFCGDSPGGA